MRLMIEFVVKIKIGIIILLFLNMQQISKNIYQIKLGMVNAFLIEDNGFTLIDTGYKNSSDKIFDAISKAGKNPNDIK